MKWFAWYVPPRLDSKYARRIGSLAAREGGSLWQPYPINSETEAWALPIAPSRMDRSLSTMLENLVQCNMDYFREIGYIVPLYTAGIRYAEETIGVEEWLSVPWVVARGQADCEDLCAWRVAELRLAGETRARCYWTKRLIGSTMLYHIQVKRGDGSIEDPSTALGMGAT